MAAGIALAAPGCGGSDGTVTGPAPAARDRMQLTSPAFIDGGSIPPRFTCNGSGVSPPLDWRGTPDGARSLALLVEDADASGGTFVHWTVWDLAPKVRGVLSGSVPAGAREGENSAGDKAYAAPCPPKGDAAHHYRFSVYALREPLGLDQGAPAQDVRDAIAQQAIARGRLTGRFER
ncbi:Putative lipoprotein LppC [Capillimicrobium parvum]|uniref:Lipoprotein LppC n=1 Tax=Capillimicrobium parvum TaxID=2884022 RepID=A0A9E7C227_9ACTN|nr:Putative lipoprotein LppC [Capillimicrobium parvum]